MGNRNNPEEEPPWVRGNLRVFGVSEVEMGRVNKPIVDCGLGDSAMDRMCRSFPCGCVLDSRWGKDFTWFPTAFFSVPPRGFMTEKAAQDALDALNKGQHLLPQVVGCLMDMPKKRGIRLPLLTYIDQHRPFWSILIHLDPFLSILIHVGGFWVSKNWDKPKSCSQAKSSWMAISWRFLGSWILVGPRRGNRGMPKSARTEGAETFSVCTRMNRI